MRGAQVQTAAVLLLCGAPAAQRLDAVGPSPPVVQLGERAEVALRLELADTGGGAELLPLPRVDGLALHASATRIEQVQHVAAGAPAARAVAHWSVWLEPQRAGSFTLPGLRVAHRGATLATGPLQLEAVAAGTADAHAFVALHADAPRYWLGETIEVRVRFGIAKDQLADHVVQPFRRQLDVPVRLRAPWLPAPPGTQGLPVDPAVNRGASFVLNDAEAEARPQAAIERDGREFAVLEWSCRLRATESGPLRLAGPLLRYSYTSRFDTGLFADRVATDLHEAFVYGDPLLLQIRALPTAGRPADFAGVVGRLTVTATAEPTELEVGESLRLTLEVRGASGLSALRPPLLDDLPGLHLRGHLEAEAEPGVRRLIYDLAPTGSDVDAVPPVEIAFFDPDTERYEVARSARLPLRITGAPAAAATGAPARTEVPAPPPAGTVGDAAATAEPATARTTVAAPPWQPLADSSTPRTPVAPPIRAALFALPWIAAAIMLLTAALRRRRDTDPDAVRARRALRRLRRSTRDAAIDRAAALTDYLAARTGCAPAAIRRPDLAEQLARHGIDRTLATDAAAHLQALLAPAYRGAQPGAAVPPAEDTVRLVVQLEHTGRAAQPRAGGRRGATVAAFVLCIAWSAAAQQGDPAAAAYRAADYETAARLLEPRTREAASAALWCNLGQCAAMTGDTARAALFFRRALALAPLHGSALDGLDKAHAALGLAPPAPRWSGERVRAIAATDPALFIAVLVQLCALGAFGLSGRRRPRQLAGAAFVAGALVAGLHVHDRLAASPATAVVTAPRADVRRAPHRDLPAWTHVPSGAEVVVHEHSDHWARVAHADGAGWVERAAVEFVTPPPQRP